MQPGKQAVAQIGGVCETRWVRNVKRSCSGTPVGPYWLANAFAMEHYTCEVMRESPTRTGVINHISGVYHSKCHSAERTILEGQVFPPCGRYNSDTVWIFIRP